jgi:Caspase domain
MKDGFNHDGSPRASLGLGIGRYTLATFFGLWLLLFLPNVVSNTGARGATAAGMPTNELHGSDGHSEIVAQDVPPPPPKPMDTQAKTDTQPKDVTATASPADAPPKQSDAKVKDTWDKAQIISGFLATVVLAGAALLINAGIQRAQIRASAANTNAQIEVTKRNNDAQLALTERTAEVQRQIQQSTLAGQLVEHLASGSALKKQIAIVALRRSLPSEMYQEIIAIVVRSETDPEVRKIALGQAATLPSAEPGVVQAIAEAAEDTARSGEERRIATNAVQQLGLRSIAPRGTFIFSSSSAVQLSMETDALQGGVFTHYLLRGLSGEASLEKDGSVRVSELAHFIIRSVMQFTNGLQSPVYVSSSIESDPIILGPGSEFTKTVVVAIGISDYREPLANLRYAASDANRVADLFQQHGAVIHRIVNATRGSLLNAVQSAVRDTDDGSLLIFYYAGHGAVGDDGMFWLLPVDANRDMLPATALSTVDLKESIFRTPARVKVLFLDTAFAGRAMATFR